MAQGVKCDVEGCSNFGTLPVDPMGGFQPLGDWVEVKIATGRFNACCAEHAAVLCEQTLAQQLENAKASEQSAIEANQKAALAHGQEWNYPTNPDAPNGQVT